MGKLTVSNTSHMPDLSPKKCQPTQFKGDPIKKKKKSSSASKSKHHESTTEDNIDGWIPIPMSGLTLGPIYFTLSSTSISAPLCIALQPTTGKVYPYVLPTPSASSSKDAIASSSALLTLDPDDLEAIVETPSLPGSEGPTDVHHVWVCTRIPDSENKVTFRSATYKFLASDEFGIVTADREARGFQEEWAIEDNSSGVRGVLIRSAYGKLLSVDVVAGGKLELRADGDEEVPGETEVWTVWMQGEYLTKAKKALLERSGVKANTTIKEDDGLTFVGDLASAEIDSMSVILLFSPLTCMLANLAPFCPFQFLPP